MSSRPFSILVLAVSLLPFTAPEAVAQEGAEATPREVHTLQEDWRFSPGEVAEAHLPGFDDGEWESVRVPHDWAIGGPFLADGDGNTGKLPWRGQVPVAGQPGSGEGAVAIRTEKLR